MVILSYNVMLAPYMLSVIMCPSVCLSQASISPCMSNHY